ncbi:MULTISPECIES: terminase large subunit [Bacillus amyloliquefaciens group]|uniref:terminase large subunit n=1 Tax=Bacillus amyloliquefaciens group TaxID=1938374 RepID=UPI00077D7B93|nr:MULTISPECIES: terminase TerL endonuclease subunit [Bacillus amyloliquefaciens group]AMQ71829.1 terminase [Bacillus amyloliquefaciens UMAF6614]MBF6667047.1 terminase large subunit [Bacillus velezensis]
MTTERIDPGTLYAKKVVSGEITACKKVIKACQRHLRDLERAADPSFEYEYRPEKAKKVIKFLEILPDISTGKPTKLALFQKFIVYMLYAWRNKETGFRRFTKAYISMARKGGKSVLVAGLSLYELIYGEAPRFDRQIYATANSRGQAKTVFKMISMQLKKIRSQSKAIRKWTKIIQNEIRYLKDDCVIMPLSRDTDNLDSLNVLIGILDEYHTASNTKMMEVLESSQGQQDQGLILIISTAGFKLNGPMYSQEYPYVDDILSGRKENENYFAIVYEQDDEEEIYDESTWIKSNPLLEVEGLQKKLLTNLRKKLKEALDKDDLNGTLVKNFNIWQSASSESFINGNDWKKRGVDDAPDITGKPVYIGIDLSRTDDLSALSFIYPLEDENETFYVDSHSFVGTKGGLDNKIERDKLDYRTLAKAGYCTITDKKSGIINLQQVVEYMINHIKEFDLQVKGIFFDPYNISLVLNEIEKYGYEDVLIEVRQGPRTLSEPTKDFRLNVFDGKITHSKNPLLDTAMHNAMLKKVNDTIQIDKALNREKIDPAAAMMNAHTGAMYHYKQEEFDWNTYYESEEFTL